MRAEKFSSSFYPNCLTELNKLESNVRLAHSVDVFKKKVLQKIRPSARSVFDIHDPIGLSYLTQLRVGLSKLNLHKFQHNFRNTLNAMCPSNDGIEYAEQFCCSAHPLIFKDATFSLKLKNYYDHL